MPCELYKLYNCADSTHQRANKINYFHYDSKTPMNIINIQQELRVINYFIYINNKRPVINVIKHKLG